MPTLQQRAGDFSNTYTAAGQQITIYDPMTNTCTSSANCGTGTVRTPFAGNIIPASRLDPASKILATYWGVPNAPGLPFTNLNNYSNNASIGGNNDEYTTRIDHMISDKQRIFGRDSYWTNLSLPVQPYNNAVCADRCAETWTSKAIVIGDTYTLSPTTIMDLRITWLRFVYDRTPTSLGTDLTKYGFPASLNNQVSFQVIPTPVVQGFSDVWTSQGPGSAIHQRNDSYALYPSFTKIMGAHTLKAGGEVRRQITNYIQSNVGSGLYNFDNLFTSKNPYLSGGGGTGVGFASFMLGLGSSGSVVTPSPYSYRNYYAGVYASDTWQASKKLTLNYGLRWELPFPEVERYDRFTVLLPNAPSPYAAQPAFPISWAAWALSTRLMTPVAMPPRLTSASSLPASASLTVSTTRLSCAPAMACFTSRTMAPVAVS